jgi:anti-anti-sigma regulatory factor
MAKHASKSVALPAVFDLDSLDAIRDALIDALEVGPVTVDAGGVERVATNGLFMLMSAAETARQHKFDFAIEAPSMALTAAIDRLGLTARFEGMTRG